MEYNILDFIVGDAANSGESKRFCVFPGLDSSIQLQIVQDHKKVKDSSLRKSFLFQAGLSDICSSAAFPSICVCIAALLLL